MRILVATDCYVFNLGGITASVLALCRGLRRCGHEVKTLSLAHGSRSYRDGDDYFIRSLPALYYPGMRISLSMGDPLLAELEAWAPDVIHAQTEGSARRFSIRLMRRCHAPLVMTCHTDYGHFVFGKARLLPPVRALMRVVGHGLYRHATRIVVPSRKAADFPFLQTLRKRMVVVSNGMEAEKYQNRFSDEDRRAFRRSLGIDDGTGVLVSVSRLSREKNVRELVAFLPELKRYRHDVVLLVVGDGPDRAHLERMARRLRVSDGVRFVGRVGSEEVWKYYAAGDVFVSASTFEVHSMSYLEALAMGLPLLCRADDALDGVLEHGDNGLVYRSQQEFIDAAHRLLSEADLRSEMGGRSLRRAEAFSCDAFASAMLTVYEDAIRESAQTAPTLGVG